MYTEALGLALILGTIGVFMLVWGTLVRVGKVRGWWVIKDTPIVPLNSVYMMIPVGITFLIWAISVLLPNIEMRRTVFINCGGPLFIVACILGLWRPRWLVPKWLLWLEDNHGEIYAQLREEAQKLGAREWEKRVNTQEGLEEWAMEVRRKYGWDHPDAGNPFT